MHVPNGYLSAVETDYSSMHYSRLADEINAEKTKAMLASVLPRKVSRGRGPKLRPLMLLALGVGVVLSSWAYFKTKKARTRFNPGI